MAVGGALVTQVLGWVDVTPCMPVAASELLVGSNNRLLWVQGVFVGLACIDPVNGRHGFGGGGTGWKRHRFIKSYAFMQILVSSQRLP